MRVRLLLADDHRIVREGFKALLEKHGFEVVAEAVDGQEAVRLAALTKPDVAVLDLSMPQLNGLDAACEILRTRPETRVILLTMHDKDHQIAAALRAGIRGYLLKTQAVDDLANAIRVVLAGKIYLSPAISGSIVEGYLSGAQVASDPLTSREREVLQLVAEGKSSKEIAVALDLSVKTVESYRTRIMQKLDIHEIATLVRYAIRRGLIEA
jgi:DNA-binding NarL/FixJ family response regulator